jgi:hypothetical protein
MTNKASYSSFSSPSLSEFCNRGIQNHLAVKVLQELNKVSYSSFSSPSLSEFCNRGIQNHLAVKV